MISETTLETLQAVARGKRIHSQFKLKNLENHGLVTLVKRNSKLEVEAITTAGYYALAHTQGEPRR